MTTRSLIKQIESLVSNHQKLCVVPAKKRIALVLSHSITVTGDNFARRNHKIAKSFLQDDYEVLCICHSSLKAKDIKKSPSDAGFEVSVDGVRYLHVRAFDTGSDSSVSEPFAGIFRGLVELISVYRPCALVSYADTDLSLSALGAASVTNLPYFYGIDGSREFFQVENETSDQRDVISEDLKARQLYIAGRAFRTIVSSNSAMNQVSQRGIDRNNVIVIAGSVNEIPKVNDDVHVQRHHKGISTKDHVFGVDIDTLPEQALDCLLDCVADMIGSNQYVKLVFLTKDGQGALRSKRYGSTPPKWLIDINRDEKEGVKTFFGSIDTYVIAADEQELCAGGHHLLANEAIAHGKSLVVPNGNPFLDFAENYRWAIKYENDGGRSLTSALNQSLKNKVTQIDSRSLDRTLIFSQPILRSIAQFNDCSFLSDLNSSMQNASRQDDVVLIEDLELRGSEPVWYSVDLRNLRKVDIKGRVNYVNLGKVKTKKAVLLVKIFDQNGNDISKALPTLAYSSHLSSKYKYLSDTNNQNCLLHSLFLPDEAHELFIGLCAFFCSGNEVVEVTDVAVNAEATSEMENSQVLVTRQPTQHEYEVSELLPHTLTATFDFETEADRHGKALIARVSYLNDGGEVIPPPYYGMVDSKSVGTFAYLNVENNTVLELIPPKSATKALIGIQTWNTKGKVWLDGKVECSAELVDYNISHSLADKKSARETNIARSLAQVKVAAVVDEFTLECFKMEVELTPISPTNWEKELDESDPDLFFVESCWFGNGNQWGGLMYGYTFNGPNQMNTLISVLNYCRRKGIPTVFWSKEDPVHYSRFGPTAKLFDYVYTTDANMIESYQRDYGIEAESLSFFCQPKVHNPVNLIERIPKAAFAGSYYSDKKERCDDFDTILGGLEKAGVQYDIYDRCLKRGASNLQFPEYFKKHVVGYLEPDEMWKAYKGYKYTVNMNTVKHSPTMFARRVYESLASGTPVVSNYSEGVVTQFGGIVCASDKQQDIVDFLEQLNDQKEYKRVVDEGVRETLGRHTLADRLEQVCRRVGIPVKAHLPKVNAIVTAYNIETVEKARQVVSQQTYLDKRLVVNLKNSNELYPYLNINSEDEVFRVLTEFAKPLDGINVALDVDEAIEPTLLEDEAIKTQYNNMRRTKDELVK